MKQKLLIPCVALVLLLVSSFWIGYASVEDTDEIHCYMDIPFEGTTPQEVRQLLSEHEEVVLENSRQDSPDHIRAIIKDFGYELLVDIAFHVDQSGIRRITIKSLDAGCWYPPNQIDAAVERDVKQFIDMEKQLAQCYGAPNICFFFAGNQKDLSGNEVYMFASGEWNFSQMMKMFQSERAFRAYSVWNNVVLTLWVNGKTLETLGGENGFDAYQSKLDLFFDDTIRNWSSKEVLDYPSTI